MAQPFITGKFLLLNSDDILGRSALAEAVKHPLAILVSEHDEPQKFGVVSMNEDGTLKAITEKPEHPETNLVSTGAFVLDSRIFDYEVERHVSGEYFMVHPLSLLAKEHPITVIRKTIWIPVGYPEDILKAEALLKDPYIEEETKK